MTDLPFLVFSWGESQSRALNLGRSSKKPPNVMGGVASDDDDDDGFVLDCFWDLAETRGALQLHMGLCEDDLLSQFN